MNPKNCPDNREESVPICNNCSPVLGDSQIFLKTCGVQVLEEFTRLA
jgi:hypothetical protein